MRLLLDFSISGGGQVGVDKPVNIAVHDGLDVRLFDFGRVKDGMDLMAEVAQDVGHVLRDGPGLAPGVVGLADVQKVGGVPQGVDVVLEEVFLPLWQRQGVRIGKHVREGELGHGLDDLHVRELPLRLHELPLEAELPHLDVLYMTRIQQERFFNEEEYLRLKGCYQLDEALLQKAPQDMPVLHPLPRIDEIKKDVDDDPRAAYFDQVHNGVYIRMAIILALLGIPNPVTGKIVLNGKE